MNEDQTDQSPEVHHPEHTEYLVDDGQRLSIAVVNAVADVADVEAREMNRTLYDTIDPDALETIFGDKYGGAERADGHVEFALREYAVTVTSDGRILVENG